MAQSWSIIILAYNEESSIHYIIDQCLNVLNKLTDNFEIIVVDDGSADKTSDIIEGFRNDHIIFHKNIKNIGIGPSLKVGYGIATKENILMVPGDAQFNVNELIPFKDIPDDTIISFYRNTSGLQYNVYRVMLSLFNKLVNRYFLGLKMRDVNWVKIYKNKNLKSIDIKLSSSLVESELCAKLSSGVNIKEVESRYLKRMGGVQKGASYKIVAKAMKDTLLLIWYVNIYKIGNRFQKMIHSGSALDTKLGK